MRPSRLLSLLLIPLATVAPAQDAVPLLEAVTRAPALEAARRRIDAARTRADSAGRLADPEVEAMGSRMVGPMDDRSTMWELNVRQPLPKKGERAADRERAQAGVSLAEADYATLAGEIAAEIAIALAEAAGADARIRLLEAQRARLDSVLQSIDARLATGSARLAERLTVQSRLSALQLTLEKERRLAADARAEIHGRLGLPPAAPLPPFAAPAPAEIVPAEAAALHLAAARSGEADALTKIARASAHPSTSVGLRLERERTRMGSEDIVGVAFSSEIPWRSRRYALADIRAAEADRAAAQAEGNAARFRILNALSRAERADRVLDTARRLAAETEARLAAEHDALSRAASVATSSSGAMGSETALLHAVDILDKSTDTQLQIIEAETVARTARAELWRYAPATQLLRSLRP